MILLLKIAKRNGGRKIARKLRDWYPGAIYHIMHRGVRRKPIFEDEMDHWEGEQLNKAKEILAYELTSMVHGAEEAEKAQSAARQLFSGVADHENMPTTQLDAALVKDGKVGLLAAMVGAKLCGSNREARQLVQQGGVLVDGEKVTDPTFGLTVEQLQNGVVIKKGKKTYHKVTL